MIKIYKNGQWIDLAGYKGAVVEVASYDNLPVPGSVNTLYVTADTNYLYRWNGSAYMPIGGDLSEYMLLAEKGAPNGVAELNSSGQVPSTQLPSYVDDVLELVKEVKGEFWYRDAVVGSETTPVNIGDLVYESAAASYMPDGQGSDSPYYHTFLRKIAEPEESWIEDPATHLNDYLTCMEIVAPESGKIYVGKSDFKTYRWSGSNLVEISKSLALGETSTTAYAGNKGKQIKDLDCEFTGEKQFHNHVIFDGTDGNFAGEAVTIKGILHVDEISHDESAPVIVYDHTYYIWDLKNIRHINVGLAQNLRFLQSEHMSGGQIDVGSTDPNQIRLLNIADPNNDMDAANKRYVNNVISKTYYMDVDDNVANMKANLIANPRRKVLCLNTWTGAITDARQAVLDGVYDIYGTDSFEGLMNVDFNTQDYRVGQGYQQALYIFREIYDDGNWDYFIIDLEAGEDDTPFHHNDILVTNQANIPNRIYVGAEDWGWKRLDVDCTPLYNPTGVGTNTIKWSELLNFTIDANTTFGFEPARSGCLSEYKAIITNNGSSNITLTFTGISIIKTNDPNITVHQNTLVLPARTTIEINVFNNHMIAYNWSV